MGNRAFLLASVVLPFGMPNTLSDGSPVGMAPSSGCMNVDDAPESMIPDANCCQKNAGNSLFYICSCIHELDSESLQWG